MALPVAKRPDDLKIAFALFQAVVRGESIKAAGIDLGLTYTQADTRFWQASRLVVRYATKNAIQLPLAGEFTVAAYRANEAFWIETSGAALRALPQ